MDADGRGRGPLTPLALTVRDIQAGERIMSVLNDADVGGVGGDVDADGAAARR